MEATDFVPIRVSTLRGNLKIPFDVYVKVAGKHILYCRKGDSFEGSRLQRLKEKKLKKMYIINEHEPLYRSYLTESIESAFDNSKNQPIENRAQVIQGAQQAAAEDVMDDPESPELYQVAKTGSSRFLDFVIKNREALRAVIDIENSDKSVGHHGVTVATLSIGIAEKLKLTETHPLQIETMVLGCLLHDIEHQHSQFDVARKISDMSAPEILTYKKHPMDGAARVQQQSHFEPLVINIILQHEEQINGSGFPKGLAEKDMDPMVMLVATANAYDRIVTFEGLKHKDALKHMLIERMGLHPLNFMKALQESLKDNGILT